LNFDLFSLNLKILTERNENSIKIKKNGKILENRRDIQRKIKKTETNQEKS